MTEAMAKTAGPDTSVDENFARKVRGLFVHFMPTRMELHHAGGGSGGASTVMFWHEQGLADLAKSGPDMVAREIWQHATDDSASYTGKQRYVLVTWVPGNKNPLRVAFTIVGQAWTDPEEDEAGFFGGEMGGRDVSPKGLMGMMMKMVHDSHQLAVVGSAKIIGAQQMSIDRLTNQQEHIFTGLSKIVDLIENLSDKTFERDMKREDQTMKRDLLKMGGQALKDNLPALMMRFNPAGGTIIEQQLLQFLGVVGQDKIMAWMADMTDEQKAAFGQLYNTLLARQNTSNQGGPPPEEPPK